MTCMKVWKGHSGTLRGKSISKSLKHKKIRLRWYSLVNVCVGEAMGKHAATIRSGKRLRLRNHLRAIDQMAMVLVEDSKLSHGIPEGFRHPILIIHERLPCTGSTRV
jgi:hypothetical protein